MPDLNDLLGRVPTVYPTYFKQRKVDQNADAYRLVVDELPSYLQQHVVRDRGYQVQGSTGRGYVTPAPWIAVFNPAITTSATSGYYPVYLYSLDLSYVCLSLIIGVTSFTKALGENDRARAALEGERARIRGFTADPAGFGPGPVNLGARKTDLHHWYEQGSIVAKRYDIDGLPSSERLEADLTALLSYYDELLDRIGPELDIDGVAQWASDPARQRPKPGMVRESGRVGRGPGYHSDAKAIGDRGEQHVMKYERARLTAAGRPDLANRVRWLAREGETPGWDIQSFEADGQVRRIEVKSSKSPRISVVLITDQERRKAIRHGAEYWIYLVGNVLKSEPVVEEIQDPVANLDWTLDQTLVWGDDNPSPVTWRLEL